MKDTPQGGSLRTRDVHTQAAGVPFHRDRPRAATHRAVLDEHAGGVRVDVQIDPLSTVRAANADGVLHTGIVAHGDRDVIHAARSAHRITPTGSGL